jgi:hypothetical protein
VQPVYARLLDLARSQAEACARGDLELAAVQLLDDRARILADAPAPNASDLDAIREVVRLDRELSAAIRARMLDLRNEGLADQHARTALSGYRPRLRQTAVAIDAAG